MKQLWGGRFDSDPASLAMNYAESIEADSRMVAEDIWGSEAHAIMLARQEIITEEELRQILKYLELAREEFAQGTRTLKRELEDVHMNVETVLIEGAGKEYGGKLHTARSRNDQVIVDSKLHLRTRLLDVADALAQLRGVLLERATNHTEDVMPGYTHTQHAQPITVGFWLSAYASALARDHERLQGAFNRANTSPLGACALAGTSFPTDRRLVAKLLGFDRVHEHALDLIGARDFVAEALSAMAILMSTLSKLAQETVLYSTYEFRMVELDDAFAFGSSIMPQKKNACLAELARARAGNVFGRLMQVLTMIKGTPIGYNRDVQEDKPPLWEALDCTEATVLVLAGVVSTLELKLERMRELAGANFSTATELANCLVRDHGRPFRESHEIVGNIVGQLCKEGKNFNDVERTGELLREHGIELARDELAAVVDPERVVRAQRSLGSTNPREVQRMIADLSRTLDRDANWSAAARQRIAAAQTHTREIVQRIIEGGSLAECRL